MSTTPLAAVRSSPLGWCLRRRPGNFAGFLICAALISYGYYLQFVKGLEPCPLCIFQRLGIVGTGIMFLVAAIHHPARRWAAHLYGGLIALVAVIGGSVSVRHVWLQHTPESQRPACGPGLDFLINTFGPLDVVRRVLRGSGECGAIDWTFLGFSIPEWTLACFIGLVIYAIYLSFQD